MTKILATIFSTAFVMTCHAAEDIPAIQTDKKECYREQINVEEHALTIQDLTGKLSIAAYSQTSKPSELVYQWTYDNQKPWFVSCNEYGLQFQYMTDFVIDDQGMILSHCLNDENTVKILKTDTHLNSDKKHLTKVDKIFIQFMIPLLYNLNEPCNYFCYPDEPDEQYFKQENVTHLVRTEFRRLMRDRLLDQIQEERHRLKRKREFNGTKEIEQQLLDIRCVFNRHGLVFLSFNGIWKMKPSLTFLYISPTTQKIEVIDTKSTSTGYSANPKSPLCHYFYTEDCSLKWYIDSNSPPRFFIITDNNVAFFNGEPATALGRQNILDLWETA